MILTELNLTTDEANKRKTLLVPVPQFGTDATIMVTEMTVEGVIRSNNLKRKVMEKKEGEEEPSQVRLTGLLICCDLLSCMVHPETGDFLLKEDDLVKFHSMINKDTFESLMLAYSKLNPASENAGAKLEEKKSNS